MSKRLNESMVGNFLPGTDYKFKRKKKEREVEREEGGRGGVEEGEIDFNVLINFKTLV